MWTLTASALTLNGVRYHGIVVRRVAGEPVPTMHFSARGLAITDLVQRGGLGNGEVVTTAGAPGSVSTVTGGPVHMYTRKLTGTLNVAGSPTAPITLSPESLTAPDVDLGFLRVPRLTFTDAVVRNVELDGGTLRVPGVSVTLG